MSAYDDLLGELGGQVDGLARRSASLIFLACGEALLPHLRAWANRRDEDPDPLLAAAAAGAESYALRGLVPVGGMRLLSRLEAATPPGDQPDATTAATAQDCWICFDVSVRIAVDRAYHPGTAVEYALEPVISAASAPPSRRHPGRQRTRRAGGARRRAGRRPRRGGHRLLAMGARASRRPRGSDRRRRRRRPGAGARPPAHLTGAPSVEPSGAPMSSGVRRGRIGNGHWWPEPRRRPHELAEDRHAGGVDRGPP